MNWTIRLSACAEKQFRRLPKPMRGRISARLTDLEMSPAPQFHKDVLPLAGELQGFLRYRVGEYQLILRVIDEDRVIAVVGNHPRGDAYKKA
jgi:mRNA interferase RelE/StbE